MSTQSSKYSFGIEEQHANRSKQGTRQAKQQMQNQAMEEEDQTV